MKILLISHGFSPDIGGIETHTQTLAQHFVELGHEVKVMTWSLGKNDFFDYDIVRKPSVSTRFKVISWSDWVIENNPTLRLSWPLCFLNKKNIVILQTWLGKEKTGFNWVDYLKKKWLEKASDVIAISKVIQNDVFSSAKIVPNAYNASIFKNLGISRMRDFVFLGRLVSDKGVDMTIQLMELLNQEYNRKFCLTIIGSGPEKNKLMELTAKKGLEDQIVFLGSVKDKRLNEELNRHKFLLVPSRWREPFGIVALEGIASGCIPIVSDDSGLVDAVGEAGITFKRNDLYSLFNEVAQLIDNTSAVDKLQKAAEKHLQSFTGKEIALKTLKVLEGI
ncbi:glycosyl transferase group 1 [Christiangramia fulva]|uniref:Glycosyl transferase group 1 n=1 Tax=Christiangramia fulva TaxID=2126553 RepID=A0A2R3Z4S1_9FLAO|nr:glycosyltransferase family 4 protein [Christiangramia fulva]AVR45276.1 glycosyl transferase group 1 [Christiangramia fulva]